MNRQTDPKDKDVLLRLTTAEYRRVTWVADRLGISVSELFRALIPNIEPPSEKQVTEEAEIRVASPHDLVPIEQSLDREKLRELLEKLQATGGALTLAKEVRRQILEDDQSALAVSTYKRLGRWCHPERWSAREKKATPIAEEISTVLYGRIVERLKETSLR